MPAAGPVDLVAAAAPAGVARLVLDRVELKIGEGADPWQAGERVARCSGRRPGLGRRGSSSGSGRGRPPPGPRPRGRPPPPPPPLRPPALGPPAPRRPPP